MTIIFVFMFTFHVHNFQFNFIRYYYIMFIIIFNIYYTFDHSFHQNEKVKKKYHRHEERMPCILEIFVAHKYSVATPSS